MEGNRRKVAIVGYGYCGQATELFLKNLRDKPEILIHDPDKGHEIKSWSGLEYAFICVPTPEVDGKLEVGIINTVLKNLPASTQAVIRSTIGPDQALTYYSNYIPMPIIMPEFIREKHWKQDVVDNDIVIGISNNSREHNNFINWIANSITEKRIYVVSPMTAAMIKVGRNSALAMKVALANDFYDICRNTGADYDDVANFLQHDKDLGASHWQVPGHDNEYGFGGSCLPKDLTHTSNICYHTNNIMNTAVEANKVRRNNE